MTRIAVTLARAECFAAVAALTLCGIGAALASGWSERAAARLKEIAK